MSEDKQYQAKTIEVAMSKAARELGVPMNVLVYQVVFDGRKGLFGFGQRDVVIRVDVEASRQAAHAAAAAAAHQDGEPVERVHRGPPGDRRAGPGSFGSGQPPRGARREPPHGQGRREERGGGRPPFEGRRGGQHAGPPRERHRPEGQPRQGEASRRGPRRGPRPEQAPFRSERPAPAPTPETPEGLALLELGRKIVGLMQLEVDCEVRELAEDQLALDMWGADEALVIGRHGEVLDAMQYLVNKIVTRDATMRDIKVVVDSAGYRRRHDREIEDNARKAAARVRQSGEAIQLEPMNPYQRRIVHLALHDEPGIKTFSIGEGFLRRLTISPSDEDDGGTPLV